MKLPQPNLEPVNRNRRNEGKHPAPQSGVTPSFLPFGIGGLVCNALPEPLKSICSGVL